MPIECTKNTSGVFHECWMKAADGCAEVESNLHGNGLSAGGFWKTRLPSGPWRIPENSSALRTLADFGKVDSPPDPGDLPSAFSVFRFRKYLFNLEGWRILEKPSALRTLGIFRKLDSPPDPERSRWRPTLADGQKPAGEIGIGKSEKVNCPPDPGEFWRSQVPSGPC